MSNNETKWKISIFSMFLFILVTNEMSYKMTDNIFGNIFGKILDENNKVTTTGYILHVLIFLLIVRYSMELNLFEQ